MGLLYVGGIPYHDEDQELIERAARRHRLARSHAILNDGEMFDGFFDDGRRTVGYGSLSDEVRACARARREQTKQ